MSYSYWATELAQQIIAKKGKKITIATGISPSGNIHIGNMREVLTADLIKRELEKLGAKVRFVYIADDFDRLRKLYPFLPKSFEKYVGWPLCDIPDPEGDSKKTYAQRFIEPFFKVLDELGINVEKLSAYKMYQEGFYKNEITKALKDKKKIIQILEQISGRSIPESWSPYNPLCKKCGKIDEAKTIEEDLAHHKVKYRCTCGDENWADYSKAEGKLVWRVDWPARWSKIPVNVEPFGKEHATKGGSYDTGVEICKQIFLSEPPIGVGYDLLYLTGFKGKMSSSLGNVISADEFLQIVPPEILRYMFARVNYDKSFYFDPGMGLLQLVDEYNRLEQKYIENNGKIDEAPIYEACQITRGGKSIAPVPFKHLVNAFQAAQGDMSEIKRILNNTGHKTAIENEILLKEQIARVKNWLNKYAPENIKFEIQKKLPKIKLNNDQKLLLKTIATDLATKEWTGEELHNHIYELGRKLGLKPKETFESIYLSLIGKTSGPKAGWFVVILDKDFVIKRFKEISN